MAWTFGDWEEQASDTLRLGRLLQFRTELRNAVSARMQSDGVSIDPETVRMLLDMTEKDRMRLQRLVDAASGTGLPRMVSTYSPRQVY